MFRAGIYRRVKEDDAWTDKLVGVVSFASKNYFNWFIESAAAFCFYDFEYGNLFGSRYSVCKVSKKDAENFPLYRESTALLLPRGGFSATYATEYREDIRNLLNGVIEVEDALTINPRVTLSEAVRCAYRFVEGVQL